MVTHDLPITGDGSAVEIDYSDGVTIIKICGELDIAKASVLRDRIAQAIGDKAAVVLVDLAGLEFCDSGGISLLVLTCKRVRANGGTFALTHLQPSVRRAFELTGVTDYLSERR
jgi:anti-anti-sigma factor